MLQIFRAKNTPPGSPDSSSDSDELEELFFQADEETIVEQDDLSQAETMAGQGTPADALQALKDFLDEINGQDCYDAHSQAVGKLSKADWLKIPDNLGEYAVPVEKVGTGKADIRITADVYAQIYFLNKAVFASDAEKVKGALLRAEMCLAGWLNGDYEVEKVAAPDVSTCYAEMLKDSDMIRDSIGDAKVLAFILPLAAEHTFRTMGHHFISSMSTDYGRKYASFFASCVLPSIADYLPADILYHKVGHWVSLTLALSVAKNKMQAAKLPNAVVIRSTAPPAGTALITTSVAVLNAISGIGLGKDMAEFSGADLTKITNMAKLVKMDPGKYHTIPMAYGKPMLSDEDKAALESAKDEAAIIAPVLQGFLDSLPRNSDLAAARSLAKHADVNPALRKQAKAFFRSAMRTSVSSLKELFNVRVKESTSEADDSDSESDT